MERRFALWVAELIRRMDEMGAPSATDQSHDSAPEDAPEGAREKGYQA
jgi:hypothetical protein